MYMSNIFYLSITVVTLNYQVISNADTSTLLPKSIFIFNDKYLSSTQSKSIIKNRLISLSQFTAWELLSETNVTMFKLLSSNYHIYVTFSINSSLENTLISVAGNASIIMTYSSMNLNTNPQNTRNTFYLNPKDLHYVKSLFQFFQNDLPNYFEKHGVNLMLEADNLEIAYFVKIVHQVCEGQLTLNCTREHFREIWIDRAWQDFKIARTLSTLSHNPSKILILYCTQDLVIRIIDLNKDYSFIGKDMMIIVMDAALSTRLKQYLSSGTEVANINIFYIERQQPEDEMQLINSYYDVIKETVKLNRQNLFNSNNQIRIQKYFEMNEYKFNNYTLLKLYKHSTYFHWVNCFTYNGVRSIRSNIICQNFGYLQFENYKKIIVAVVPSDPFIKIDTASELYINEVSQKPECGHNVVCYEVPSMYLSSENFDVYKYIQQLLQNVTSSQNTNNVRCCYGFSITLLQKLAMDLKYEMTFYIAGNQSYGQYYNDQWNGMVKEILIGTAHIGAGAFSITRERGQFIDMSDPYYTSDIEILNLTEERENFLGAVFLPFKVELWIYIFVLATVCAITLATLEWRSPFGLNPWGRQRDKNYTISSALNSVYAIMFGHTIKTKAPKSWPVKWVQNCWSFACIIIVAMYTANLTVFIAGVSHASDAESEIKVTNQEVGIIKQNNIIDTLRELNDKRYPVSKWKIKYLDNYMEAEKMFLNKSLTIYVDESLVIKNLKFKLSYCNVKTRKINLGPIGYGLGFSKDSMIKEEIKQRLRVYGDFGFFDFLDKSVSQFSYQCKENRVMDGLNKFTKEGYKIENMAGLFVALSIGFVVSFIVLFLEHMLYWWVVPYWHKLPIDSGWKSIHIMFLSQRLHRIIHSERLILPKETTKEMIDIVKNREFGKVFFKENVHKPIPSRKSSVSKVTVFDISSEMVKLKRQSKSQENIARKRNNATCYGERSKSCDGIQRTLERYCQKFLSFQETSSDTSNPSESSMASQDNSLRIAFHNPIEED